MAKKNVLITGATGFIGGHILDENLVRGNRVRAFVLPGDPAIESLKKRKVEVFEGDITDYRAVREAVRGMKIVFHCAAVVTDWAPRSLFERVTLGGAENICRACSEEKVDRLVDISTNDVFGMDEKNVMDESFPLRPWGEPYPDFKIKSEQIMWRYHREKGLRVSMVYPCWVYGRNDRTFVPLLADAIIKGDLIFWRKYVLVWPAYVLNVVDLVMLIAQDDRAIGRGYLVHDGESDTFQNFCAHIARAVGCEPIKTHSPYFAAYAAAFVMEGLWKILGKKTRPLLTTYTVKNLGSRFRFSIDRAKRELGWAPKYSYREAFAETLEWLKTVDIESYAQK
ncbi:MAG TPA: NAD-dependent epimerase/dehydratase family protein [Spirochaetota bacterium]|nr:NAD-dependent epimerase/dehydratase family protein [Spirochaetota bacterium]